LYLDLIKQGKPEKRGRYLKIIEEQVHRLRQLVEDILDLSRLEAGRNKIEFAPVELNEVVGQIVALQQARAEEKGLALRFTPDKSLPIIHGIRSQFSQVVVNLVTNSINYTRTGEVHVRTQWSDEKAQVCLQVSDTGSGILPEEMPYIYDRFYRGRNHRQGQIPGTGLGLAIVKDIVEIHDGEIEVESNVGQGTIFRIWLPVSSDYSFESGTP
jgi:signal transduction histidine kinase